MRHATFAAALLLAACSKPDAPATELQPGRWTGTVEFETASLPQAGPALVPTSGTIDKCLTSEQARRPADFLVGGHGSCDKSGVRVENGRIEGNVRCPPELGGTSRIDGQYTATSYQLTITTGSLTGRSKVDRIGECTSA
jgi:hypothetical protein